MLVTNMEIEELLNEGNLSEMPLLQLDNAIQVFLETDDSIFDYGADTVDYFVNDVHEFSYWKEVYDDEGNFIEIIDYNVKFKVIDNDTENIENTIVTVTEIEIL